MPGAIRAATNARSAIGVARASRATSRSSTRPPSRPPSSAAGPALAALMRVVVHVDGGARGNPGPAAGAAVVSDPEGRVLDEAAEVLGITTNNVAEYRGLLLGLGRARELGATEVDVINDSELVAKQVNGE